MILSFKIRLFITLAFNILFLVALNAQTFKKAPSTAIDVAIDPSNGKVYVIGEASKNVFYYNTSAKRFRAYLNGADAQRITVSSTGDVFIVRQNKKVAKVVNSKWEDVKPFSYSKDIAGDEKGDLFSVFAINGKAINYKNGNWQNSINYGNKYDRIAARHSKDVWLVGQDKRIKHYFKNKLNSVAGRAIDIAIDFATKDVYIVGGSKQIFKWNKSKKDWDKLPGTRTDIKNIAVHNNQLWCTTFNNQIYYADLASGSSSGNDGNFTFSKNKKKVVVLLHGITASSFTPNGKSNGVGTYRYPQYYWGYDFIRHVAGVSPSNGIKIMTPPNSGLSARSVSFDSWGNHYNGIAKFMRNKVEVDKYAIMLRPNRSNVDFMCTFRDGAATFMPQTKAAINQIYDTYQEYYGMLPMEEQPMIYLIGHSFGGIISRAILSNPTEADRGYVILTEEERKRADFIRNRTVWLTTLATPHEGSPLPAKAHETDADLKKMVKAMRSSPYFALADGLEQFRREEIDANKPCLNDIKNNNFYLKGMLKPEYAKRTNGDLVPIYTLTGSHPGHVFYLHKRALGSLFDNSISDITRKYKDVEKEKGYYKLGDQSFKLLALDKLNSGPKNYWPRVYSGGQDGDKFKVSAYNDPADELIRTGIQVEMRKDNYFDSDGFVSFNSGHGLKLTGSKVGHFSGFNGGSWYRIYGKDYGSFHPWNLDNHRSICFNRGTAAFIGNYLMPKGPNAVRDYWSSWRNKTDTPRLKKKRVKVEFTHLKNTSGEDIGSDGYRVEVKIGSAGFQKSQPIKEKKTIDSKFYQSGKDYFWTFSAGIDKATLVPVIIKVYNYRANLNDQLCSASPKPYVEELVFYVDAQNNKVYGDIEGKTGNLPFRVSGARGDKRIVALSLRVKVENM